MNEQHNKIKHIQVLVIGAGASGLYCGLTAGQRGRQVMVIDHANRAGKKILMSGGGRCNFTNYFVEPENFISRNAHFCKSALTRYQSWEFISLMDKHKVAYEERQFGQLFGVDSAKDILNVLLQECETAKVSIQLKTEVLSITALNNANDSENNSINAGDSSHKTAQSSFKVVTKRGDEITAIICQSLVIATGGLSIPKMGATGFGYDVAKQFGHDILPTSAGLVPFTFTDDTLSEMFKSLSGISLDVIAFNERISFARPILFTHRGLSGFAILQLSNYWQVGESIFLNIVPKIEGFDNAADYLLDAKHQQPKRFIRSVLQEYFPKKLLLALQTHLWQEHAETELANIKDEILIALGGVLNAWELKPSGTEGYRTAEVTMGGVATDLVSSKTFESQKQSGLYFIGEVLDVTGWLGGFNFQWAWASGHACGQVV